METEIHGLVARLNVKNPAWSVDGNSTERAGKEKRPRRRGTGGLHLCAGCAPGAGRMPLGEVQ